MTGSFGRARFQQKVNKNELLKPIDVSTEEIYQ